VATDIVGERLHRLVTGRGVLLERLQKDRLEIAAQEWFLDARPRGGSLDDQSQGLGERAPAHVVRQLTGEHFVEHDTEGVHVTSKVDFIGTTARLLGAHVGERALDRLDGGGRHRHGEIRIGDSGQAEVEDLHDGWSRRRIRLRLDDHVRRFEIPVDDAALVGVAHPFTDLEEERQTGANPAFARPSDRRERREGFAQGRSTHELHGEVVAVVRLAGLVDGGDVRVLKPRERPDLAFVETKPPSVDEGAAANDLQRDAPPRVVLLGLVHDTHATLAELRDDSISPELGAEGSAREGPLFAPLTGDGSDDLALRRPEHGIDLVVRTRGQKLRGHGVGGVFEESFPRVARLGRGVCGQEGLDLRSQLGVGTTRVIQHRRTVSGFPIESETEDLLGSIPPLALQRQAAPLP
jgi:hypothetical protein